MYKMIRCGSAFGLVIMVSPADATPDTTNATFYRCAEWKIGDQEPGIFHEVSRNTALAYFSGMGDSCGFDVVPDDSFSTLEAAAEFVEKKRNEHGRRRLIACGIDPDASEEEQNRQMWKSFGIDPDASEEEKERAFRKLLGSKSGGPATET